MGIPMWQCGSSEVKLLSRLDLSPATLQLLVEDLFNLLLDYSLTAMKHSALLVAMIKKCKLRKGDLKGVLLSKSF